MLISIYYEENTISGTFYSPLGFINTSVKTTE